MESLIVLIVVLAIFGGLAMLGLWVIDTLGVPAPLNAIAKVLIAVVAVLGALYYALPMLPPLPHR